MTIDTVVQKTAMTLGVTILVAAATWVLTPDLDGIGTNPIYMLAMLGAFGGFALAMVKAIRKNWLKR